MIPEKLFGVGLNGIELFVCLSCVSGGFII